MERASRLVVDGLGYGHLDTDDLPLGVEHGTSAHASHWRKARKGSECHGLCVQYGSHDQHGSECAPRRPRLGIILAKGQHLALFVQTHHGGITEEDGGLSLGCVCQLDGGGLESWSIFGQQDA